eukprot:2504971-Pyramimonas_sp.AAC.1
MSLARTAGAWENNAGFHVLDDRARVFGLSEQAQVAVARACPRHSFRAMGASRCPCHAALLSRCSK